MKTKKESAQEHFYTAMNEVYRALERIDVSIDGSEPIQTLMQEVDNVTEQVAKYL